MIFLEGKGGEGEVMDVRWEGGREGGREGDEGARKEVRVERSRDELALLSWPFWSLVEGRDEREGGKEL